MIEETLVEKAIIIAGIKKEYSEKLEEISKATGMGMKLDSIEWTDKGIIIRVKREILNSPE